jgi:hypothetical protein
MEVADLLFPHEVIILHPKLSRCEVEDFLSSQYCQRRNLLPDSNDGGEVGWWFIAGSEIRAIGS